MQAGQHSVVIQFYTVYRIKSLDANRIQLHLYRTSTSGVSRVKQGAATLVEC